MVETSVGNVNHLSNPATKDYSCKYNYEVAPKAYQYQEMFLAF